MNIEERRKYDRDWYHAHQVSERIRRNKRIKKNRKFLKSVSDNIKLIMGCKACGYDTHPKALQFHHREPLQKKFAIAEAGNLGANILRLLSEIEKCDILCANCHAIHHA